MSNSRRLRRGIGNYGHLKQATAQTVTQCPHCASTIDLMATEAEWDDVRAAHLIEAGPLRVPTGATVLAWWFCHHCAQGGALLGQPPMSVGV